jgi:hypothetical protein
MKKILKILFLVFLVLMVRGSQGAQAAPPRWSAEKAWKWYNSRPWICGFNYIPSNAVNYTAMWDKTSFSPDLIEKELALAETTGFNTVRVIIQYAVWKEDPGYLKQVFTQFLSICRKHGISVIPVLFDDCVFGPNVDPTTGEQPEPLEGWYAWAWSPSPGWTVVADTSKWDMLEKYVKDLLGTFSNNTDVILWDLYNEPADNSLELVRKVFGWAREVNSSQPLTVCMFGSKDLLALSGANSDIITFHNYSPLQDITSNIAELKMLKRPVICTEWLNRPWGSTVESVLPMFYDKQIGCLHWGLVNGKTQTDLPWGHRPWDGTYTSIWQHDIYTNDMKMYSPYEFVIFRKYISMAREAWKSKAK